MLGAVVTTARLTKDGTYLLMVESGSFCIWKLDSMSVVYKEFITDVIVDVILYEQDEKCFIVTKQGESQKQTLTIQSREIPSGVILYEIKLPVLRIKPICLTYEGAYLVTLAWEKKVKNSSLM